NFRRRRRKSPEAVHPRGLPDHGLGCPCHLERAAGRLFGLPPAAFILRLLPCLDAHYCLEPASPPAWRHWFSLPLPPCAVNGSRRSIRTTSSATSARLRATST